MSGAGAARFRVRPVRRHGPPVGGLGPPSRGARLPVAPERFRRGSPLPWRRSDEDGFRAQDPRAVSVQDGIPKPPHHTGRKHFARIRAFGLKPSPGTDQTRNHSLGAALEIAAGHEVVSSVPRVPGTRCRTLASGRYSRREFGRRPTGGCRGPFRHSCSPSGSGPRPRRDRAGRTCCSRSDSEPRWVSSACRGTNTRPSS